MKFRKFFGVSRVRIEDTLKSLNIGVKVLARISNAMWGSVLANEDQTSSLAGSILSTKSVKMQTEYFGTRRARITLHGVSMDITEFHLAAFFARY